MTAAESQPHSVPGRLLARERRLGRHPEKSRHFGRLNQSTLRAHHQPNLSPISAGLSGRCCQGPTRAPCVHSIGLQAGAVREAIREAIRE